MSETPEAIRYIDIVFDGPPGPEAGRFVEVEDENGRSLNFGEWIHRDDGYWVLRVLSQADAIARAIQAERTAADARVERMRERCAEAAWSLADSDTNEMLHNEPASYSHGYEVAGREIYAAIRALPLTDDAP